MDSPHVWLAIPSMTYTRSIQHNEIWDVSFNLLAEVCYNNCVEPVLQPPTGVFQFRSANTQNEARCDIHACVFLDQRTGCIVWWESIPPKRVFVQEQRPWPHCTRCMKMGMQKREYGERVRDVEHGVFTPLVQSTSGGRTRETTTFFEKLVTGLASSRKLYYSIELEWLRCRILNTLFRSGIMAIRGSRSLSQSGAPADILLATSEGNVPRL